MRPSTRPARDSAQGIMRVKQCHKPPIWEWCIQSIKMVKLGMIYYMVLPILAQNVVTSFQISQNARFLKTGVPQRSMDGLISSIALKYPNRSNNLADRNTTDGYDKQTSGWSDTCSADPKRGQDLGEKRASSTARMASMAMKKQKFSAKRWGFEKMWKWKTHQTQNGPT